MSSKIFRHSCRGGNNDLLILSNRIFLTFQFVKIILEECWYIENYTKRLYEKKYTKKIKNSI